MIRNYVLLGFAGSFALSVAACSSPKDNGNGAGLTDTTRLAPVETSAPNTDYKPAFAGQTRIGGVKTSVPLEVTVLTKELNRPWAIINLPGDRFLVTDKEKGVFRIVSKDGQVSEPVTGLPEVDPAGQGGLLDVALDPDFNNNRMIYWTYSGKSGSGNLTAVAKGKLSADEKRMEQVQVIYEATPAYAGRLHYGSRILFDKDGHIIFSTGERSDLETRPQSQDLNSALGKIIRITKDGKPAPGNPFEGQAGKRPEIYSYGHRNVQGLAFHPVTGDLWENEFGPKGGDELNRVEPGKNYGWPIITYGVEYKGPKIGEGITQREGLEQPVYYWDPVLSPSGMTFYTSDVIPEWKNNLFIAGLSSTHIARLVIENNKVTGEERLLADQGQRFRDVTEGPDGALYAVTDGGWLVRAGKK